MKTLSLAAVAFAFLLTLSQARAADPSDRIPTEAKSNAHCSICGNPVNPAITMKYEGLTYSFDGQTCLTKFKAARENSLYQKLGGKAAIDAAVEAFYVKVLADERVKHFFDDINMNKQRRKQKEFLSAAFGGPIPWTGKDLRKAHANVAGLNETHFNAIAENLKSTLEDLKVKKELIDQVMAIAGSVKDDVLNRPKQPK